MALLRSTMTMAVGLAGALGLSQAPEFAQQYRQRLGGALEEVQRIVRDFDADAARSGLTRDEAVALHLGAKESLFRDRGLRVRQSIERQELLQTQARWFETLPAPARPLAIIRGYDEALMAGMWRDYEPGLPLTPHGAIWAGAGFLTLAGLFMLVTAPYARWRRRRRLRRDLAAISAPPEPARRAVRGSG
jgi:hypothetical protein